MTLTIHSAIALLDIIRLYGGHKPAPREYVRKTFHEKPVMQAMLPNYADTELFCKRINLITSKDGGLALTDFGEKTLEYYEGKKPELHEHIIKNVLLGSEVGGEIQNILSKFHLGDDYALWYQKHEIQSLFTMQDMLPILYEVGLLEKRGSRVEINPKYVQLVMREGHGITQKQLEAHLRNQKVIGAIAEEIVLAFEQDRLAREGYVQESKKIEQVSDRFANAGYDIASFSKDQDGKMGKIYIEVKGSSGTEFDIYVSANELSKAKEHGDRYMIYFVPGIDVKTHRSSGEIAIIKNPSKAVFDNPEYAVETEAYHITKLDT